MLEPTPLSQLPHHVYSALQAGSVTRKQTRASTVALAPSQHPMAQLLAPNAVQARFNRSKAKVFAW